MFKDQAIVIECSPEHSCIQTQQYVTHKWDPSDFPVLAFALLLVTVSGLIVAIARYAWMLATNERTQTQATYNPKAKKR